MRTSARPPWRKEDQIELKEIGRHFESFFLWETLTEVVLANLNESLKRFRTDMGAC